MFWRRRRSSDDEIVGEKVTLDLPPLDELENWVLQLVIKLKLKPGEFTFLPGYSGVLLFVKNEGISWIPYTEIKDALGEVQKTKLIENTATLGGFSALAATGGSLIPAILVHRLLKGSYRILAKPSPSQSMSFLMSMIDKVIIEEKPLRKSMLKTFEQSPYKNGTDGQFMTAMITIKRKFLDDNSSGTANKIIKNVKTFFVGSSDPVFVIPPQSDVNKFASILETFGVEVEKIVNDKLPEPEADSYLIEDGE